MASVKGLSDAFRARARIQKKACIRLLIPIENDHLEFLAGDPLCRRRRIRASLGVDLKLFQHSNQKFSVFTTGTEQQAA